MPRSTHPVVHCRTRYGAERVFKAIEARLAECGLTMHPEKSRIVHCYTGRHKGQHEHRQFTFLGFTFKLRSAINRQGKRFTAFLPAVSREALQRMRDVVRSWRLVRQTPNTLEVLSEKYNRVLRGWWQYYGAFYPSELGKLAYYLNERLAYWARRKYKRLRGCRIRSHRWLCKMAQVKPWLFVHWEHTGG